MEDIDFLTRYIHKMSKEINDRAEAVVLEFLQKEGYNLTIVTHESIKALQRVLAAQNKRLRVETFYKFTGDTSVEYLVLPFFEPLDYPIGRRDVYNSMNLAEKGYSRW